MTPNGDIFYPQVKDLAQRRRRKLSITEQFPGELPPVDIEARRRREELPELELELGEVPPVIYPTREEVAEWFEPLKERQEILGLFETVFPELFDPRHYFGYAPEEIPFKAIETVSTWATEDPERFIEYMRAKGRSPEAEALLELMAEGSTHPDGTPYTAEEIDALIEDIFAPPLTLEPLEIPEGGFKFTQEVEGIERLFTIDKDYLVKMDEELVGKYDPERGGIEIFGRQEEVVEIKGVRTLVTIAPDGRAYNDKGQWIGTYNRSTKVFNEAKNDEGWFKDNIIDPWTFAANRLGHGLTQFGAGTLANLLYPPMPEWYPAPIRDFMNETNKSMRDGFREVYALNKKDFEEWVVDHPELIPKPKYEEGLSEHPELLLDPGYFAYEFTSTAPVSLGVMTVIAGGLITGNPVLGVLGGAAIMTPAESADAYQALLDSGVPEDEASAWSLVLGTTASLIETFSDLLFLKYIASPVVSLFRKEAVKEMAKATAAHLIKKGAFAYTATNAIEIFEEELTLVINNAVFKIYDENKGLWDDMLRTAAKTFAAVSPIAMFTGAATVVGVSRQQAAKVSDEMKIEMGWTQDPSTKDWFRPMTKDEILDKLKKVLDFEIPLYEIYKGERGALGLPEEKPEVAGEQIAKETGLRYDGIQEELGMQFTDVEVTGTTFYAQSLAEAKRKLVEKRKLFAEKPPLVAEVKPPAKPEVPEVVPPIVREGASGRVMSRIEMKPAEPKMAEKIKSGWHRFNVKMVDDLYAIRQFTEEAKKGGIQLSIEENPYMLARLLKGITSKSTTFLEKGTFGKKFWKVEKGKSVPNFTGESLENILSEVKETSKWQDFSTYLVAKRAFDLSLRKIETGISKEDAAAAIDELEKKYANFSDLADRIYKYQDRLLDYTHEMGLISTELLEKIRKFGSYVPFYRVFNELQAKGFMGKKMANIAKPIKKIKGSEREIINPLESIIKNTYTLINAADRNQVGIAMANLVDQNPEIADLFERVKTPTARVAQVSAQELGVEIEGLSEGEADQVVDIFRPSFFVRGDEVTVLIDGEKKYFRVDSDLRDALLTLDRESIGLLGKILGAPAKWLRAGATLSPDFMVRNPARDQMTAFVYSNYGFLPGIDFMKGVAGIVARDQDYQLFRMSGAEHSMLVSMDRLYLRKTFDEIIGGKKFTDYIKHPLELFQIISELGEKATRLGEFKGGIRRGAVPLQAGFSARNVSLDFAQSGTSAKAVNRLIAFFNANIRGWGRMVSSFKEHPTRTALKIFAGITMPSILLYLANRDDPRWKEIPQWQKDLFWIVFTEDHIYRIPKPFELGIIFGSGPERFLEWLDNKDPKLMKDMLANLAEAGSPGFIPTAILPIIENMSNYSFFRGREIVPPSRKRMPPELQYTRWTTEVSKKVGELIGYSPAKIDNIINGWTGGLGRYAVNILDRILKETGVVPDIPEPSPTLEDTPVVKAFVIRNPYGSSSESITRFYEQLEEYEEGEKYLKEMLSLGEIAKFEKYKGKHPELLFFYDFEKGTSYSASARYLRKVARELSEIRKKEDEIYNSKTISASEKRRLIDEIDKVRWQVAERALKLFPGEVPIVMEKQLKDADGRLGEVIEDVPPLSLDKPKIYNMRSLSADYANLLESVSIEDIVDKKGVPNTVRAWYEKEEAETTQLTFVNTPIYQVDTDAELELLTKRQRELWNKYRKTPEDQRDAWLEANPEATINPRNEWLKANPIENARLAVWGQAKILSLEAYDEFNRLIKELDIPDAAIQELTLPPKGSVENYFKYQDVLAQPGRAWNSWESQIIWGQDDALREFLEYDPIETPVRALELRIQWRKTSEAYDLLETDEDREFFNAENTDWVDDMRRVKAIENDGADFVDAWVDRGHTIDEFGDGSSEALVWLLDTLDPKSPFFGAYDWAIDNELLTDRKEELLERALVLRINKEWSAEDAELAALETDEERDAYKAGNEEYRKAWRRRQAYGLKDPKTGESWPSELVEPYVNYYEEAVKGFRQERMLIDENGNPTPLGLAMKKFKGVKIPKLEDVHSVKWDTIYEANKDRFDKLWGLNKIESDYYEADEDERKKITYAMRFNTDGTISDFYKNEIRLAAYEKNVPEKYIENYVAHEKIMKEGKPSDWPDNTPYYEDEWYMQEHPEFYKDMEAVGAIGSKDFEKVPTREVFDIYKIYRELEGTKNKMNYRLKHPELDKWGQEVFGWKPAIEQVDLTKVPKEDLINAITRLSDVSDEERARIEQMSVEEILDALSKTFLGRIRAFLNRGSLTKAEQEALERMEESEERAKQRQEIDELLAEIGRKLRRTK